MATPGASLRIPTALAALIDAEAQRSERSRTQVILDVLAAHFIGDDSAPAREPKAAKRAPIKPAPIVQASKLKERDLSPRLKAAPSGQAGRSSGVVSGLDIPLGNQRGPLQKGTARDKAKAR